MSHDGWIYRVRWHEIVTTTRDVCMQFAERHEFTMEDDNEGSARRYAQQVSSRPDVTHVRFERRRPLPAWEPLPIEASDAQ